MPEFWRRVAPEDLPPKSKMARIKEAKAEMPGSVSMPCAQCPRASSCDMTDEFHFSLPQLVGARREALKSALLREPSAVTLPPMNPDLDP